MSANKKILTDTDPMPFGKHCGRPMAEVPGDWLDWFHGACNRATARPDALRVIEYIERNRTAIDTELSDVE